MRASPSGFLPLPSGSSGGSLASFRKIKSSSQVSFPSSGSVTGTSTVATAECGDSSHRSVRSSMPRGGHTTAPADPSSDPVAASAVSTAMTAMVSPWSVRAARRARR